MASNQTSNYKLSQWAADDRVLRADFNADNAKIDAALAAKAEASTVSALQTAVSGKADASTVTALQNTVGGKADASTVSALQKALGGGGGKNCRIFYGTHTGDGSCGEANPTTFTAPFYPVFFAIAPSSSGIPIMRPSGFVNGINVSTWLDNGIRLYANSADNQFNYRGHTYCYIFIGYDLNS